MSLRGGAEANSEIATHAGGVLAMTGGEIVVRSLRGGTEAIS